MNIKRCCKLDVLFYNYFYEDNKNKSMKECIDHWNNVGKEENRFCCIDCVKNFIESNDINIDEIKLSDPKYYNLNFDELLLIICQDNKS